MAPPEVGVPCPCQGCKGIKVLHSKTVRKHLELQEKSAVQVPKKQKTDEVGQEDYLHKGTTVTGFLLCIRILALYNNFAGVTQQCIDEVLKIIIDVLGTLVGHDKIPRNFRSLQSFLNTLLVPVKRMTACPEECSLFDGDKHNCDSSKCRGKESAKTYHYIPLIPRLQQLYANPEISEKLQEHNHSGSNNMTDVHDSLAWKTLYGKGGKFENDKRAIALEFSADGFAPFHHSTTKPYSVEQQASIILNLPPDMRTLPGFVLLHGLIPGPQPPKEESYNTYLGPFVDELEELKKGVMTYDAYRKEYFILRAAVMIHVHDFPGQAKVFQGIGSGGKFACPMCKTEGIYSTNLRKTIYRGGREFLEPDDELRLDRSFPGGDIELGRPKLRDFAHETLLAALCGAMTDKARDAPPRSEERRIAKAAATSAMNRGSRKRCSAFDRLGDEEASKIAVEGMHTIQGVAKNLHGILNGHKDGVGVRDHEKALQRFPGCYADDRGHLPSAPFTLKRGDMELADGRMGLISVPPGKGFLPKAIFGKFHAMKSHTWHLILTRGVYLFVLRGLLGKAQRDSLVKFCHIMAICAARCVYSDLLPRMKTNLHRCLSLMDKEFPETLKTILWHMLRHFPGFLERFGPIHSYWMFYFERQIHHHVSRLHNQKHPEASMINSYRIDILCTMMKYTNSSSPAVVDSISERPTEVTRFYTHEGRGFIWKGEEKWPGSGSVVFTRDSDAGKISFGKVMFFYEFDFQGRKTFASVHWFDSPNEDSECKLFTCNPNSHDLTINPAIAIEDLSDPLIVAVDNNMMYILDFLDRTRIIQLMDWMESRIL